MTEVLLSLNLSSFHFVILPFLKGRIAFYFFKLACNNQILPMGQALLDGLSMNIPCDLRTTLSSIHY